MMTILTKTFHTTYITTHHLYVFIRTSIEL